MDSVIRAKLEKAVVSAMDHASKNVMQWCFDDCSMWPAIPLKEVFGYDAVEEYRGLYVDREGALKALGVLGLGYALRRAAKNFKWKRIEPEEAQVGDIGLAIIPVRIPGLVWEDTEDNFDGEKILMERMVPTPSPVTMICRAPGWFVARNETGYTALTHKVVRIAWSVIE